MPIETFVNLHSSFIIIDLSSGNNCILHRRHNLFEINCECNLENWSCSRKSRVKKRKREWSGLVALINWACSERFTLRIFHSNFLLSWVRRCSKKAEGGRVAGEKKSRAEAGFAGQTSCTLHVLLHKAKTCSASPLYWLINVHCADVYYAVISSARFPWSMINYMHIPCLFPHPTHTHIKWIISWGIF